MFDVFVKHCRLWIDVIAYHTSSEQRSFDDRCSPPHKGIVHQVTSGCESFNEEPRKLWFEARSIGNLVERGSLSLTWSPEFSGKAWNPFALDRKLIGLEARPNGLAGRARSNTHFGQKLIEKGDDGSSFDGQAPK